MGLTLDPPDHGSRRRPQTSNNDRQKRRRLSSGAYTYIPAAPNNGDEITLQNLPDALPIPTVSPPLPPATPTTLRTPFISEVLSPPPTISSMEALNSLRERLQNVRENNTSREAPTTTTATPTHGILLNGRTSRDREDERINESLSRFNQAARGLMASRRGGRSRLQPRRSIHFQETQTQSTPQEPEETTEEDADDELLTSQPGHHNHTAIQQRLRNIRMNRQRFSNDLNAHRRQQRLHLLTQSRIPDMVPQRTHTRINSELRNPVITYPDTADPESDSSSDSNGSIVQEGNHPAVTYLTSDNDNNPNETTGNNVSTRTPSHEFREARATGDLLRLPSIRVPAVSRRRRRSVSDDEDNNEQSERRNGNGSGTGVISDISHYTRLTRNRRRRLNLPYIRFSNPQFIFESNENDETTATTTLTPATSTTTSAVSVTTEPRLTTEYNPPSTQPETVRGADSYRDNIRNPLTRRNQLLNQMMRQRLPRDFNPRQSIIETSFMDLIDGFAHDDNQNADYSTLLRNDDTNTAPAVNDSEILSHADPESSRDADSEWVDAERTIDHLPQPLNDIHQTAMIWRDYMAAAQTSVTQTSSSDEVRDRTSAVWNTLLNLINMTDSLSSLATTQRDLKFKHDEAKRKFKTDEEKFTPELIQKLNQASKAKFGRAMPSGIIYPNLLKRGVSTANTSSVPSSYFSGRDKVGDKSLISTTFVENSSEVHDRKRHKTD